jgi:TRAP-type mannitol/chloroaromatic compound transport system permease small subunit
MSDQGSGPDGAGVEKGLAPPKGGAFALALNGILTGMNTVGSAWILVLVLLINADALGRTFFLAPIDGVIEIIELSLVGIIFLQLGDATRRGRLTRSDGFFSLVQQRRPKIGRAMGVVFDLAGALFMLLVVYGSIPLLIESVEEDFYVGVQGLFAAPVWPVKLVIVIGATVTALQFLVFAWRYIRPLGSGRGDQGEDRSGTPQ